MKKVILVSAILSISACATRSAKINIDSYDASKPICLLSGMPPAKDGYKVIKKLKYAKGGYGSINLVIPEIVRQAREIDADAIIDYNGGQRFGFWPWQFVRPVVSGKAVKWDAPESIDCEGMGGTYKTQLTGPLTTDV